MSLDKMQVKIIEQWCCQVGVLLLSSYYRDRKIVEWLNDKKFYINTWQDFERLKREYSEIPAFVKKKMVQNRTP